MSKDELEVAEKKESTTDEERAVRCARCGHALARTKDAMHVGGAHVHTFVNPQGHEFTIACYSRADGCGAFGERETFWSWFPGHAWQIAVCGACGTHTGWRFFGEGAAFVGLIVDAIAT